MIHAIVFVLLCMFGNLGFAQIPSKALLPSTMVWTRHNSIIIHEGDQEDEGDDDVKQIAKNNSSFFFLMKILSVSHNKTKRTFFIKKIYVILFQFNSSIPPPKTILSQSQNSKILGPPKFLTCISIVYQWPGHAPCFIKLMVFKVLAPVQVRSCRGPLPILCCKSKLKIGRKKP